MILKQRKSFFLTFLLSVFGFFTLFSIYSQKISAQSLSQSLPQSTSQFSRNLRLGDYGADVLALQKMLNTSVDTQVASSGAGSKGAETEYFGLATQAAVIRFQNKHEADILIPAGLTEGNGFVGTLTRAALSQLSLSSPNSSINSSPNSSPNFNSNSNLNSSFTDNDQNIPYFRNLFSSNLSTLALVKSSARTGLYGSTLVIYGSGLTDTDNTIHFTNDAGQDYTLPHVAGIQQVKISFAIPQTFPLGLYTVWVSNSNGMSNKNLFFVIVAAGTQPPAITSISPQNGAVDSIVTVSGQNFSAENQIRTPYGIITNVPSSDGKTMQFPFTYPNFEQLQKLRNSGKIKNDLSIRVPLGIVNDNGAAVDSAFFTVTVNKTN